MSILPAAPKHIAYFDVLRAVAIIAVVVVHAAATDWYRLPVAGFAWQTLNVLDGAVRFCVPIFFMISGALFLDPTRDVTIRKIFTRSLPRIAVPFVVWSTFYAAVTTFGPGGNQRPGSFIVRAVQGHHHLWFLFALAGLYLATPLLRRIVADRRTAWYFVALAIPFAILAPLLKRLPVGGDLATNFVAGLQVHAVLGYSIYFVLGYLLHTAEIDRRRFALLIALGCGGVLVTVVGTSVLSLRAGRGFGDLYLYLTPNVLLASIAVFLLAKRFTPVSAGRSPSLAMRATSVLSTHSFGIYLAHPAFILAFGWVGWSAAAPLQPVLGVPLLASVIVLLSLLVAVVLSRIPRIGSYLV